jgi:hypothetical protein
MNDRPKARERQAREDRLREALRENLKRRKAQARRRGSAAEHEAAKVGGGRGNEKGEKAATKDES